MATPLSRLKKQCVSLAMAIYIGEHPNCELCGGVAHTCHHFIHQGRSNYLRCDMRNLVAICQSCHCLLHHSHEQVFAGRLIKQRGMKWFNAMEKDSHIKIKDNMEYWRNKLSDLRGEK